MAGQKHITARRQSEATVASLFEVWQDRHAATVASDDMFDSDLECKAIDRLVAAPSRTFADLAAKIAAVTEMGADAASLAGPWGEQIAAEAVRLLMSAWAEAA